MKRDEGGPAFPTVIPRLPHPDDCKCGDCSTYGEPRPDVIDGMSLRDYFAGQALMGMIASSPVCDRTDPTKVNHQGWACQAYRFADAMIKARKRRQVE